MPPLVDRNGAEPTLSVTTPVCGEGKPNGIESGHLSLLLYEKGAHPLNREVHGSDRAASGETGKARRVLDQEAGVLFLIPTDCR